MNNQPKKGNLNELFREMVNSEKVENGNTPFLVELSPKMKQSNTDFFQSLNKAPTEKLEEMLPELSPKSRLCSLILSELNARKKKNDL